MKIRRICRRWRWQKQQNHLPARKHTYIHTYTLKFQRHNYQNKLKCCNISDCIINEKNARSIQSQVALAQRIDSLAQNGKCKRTPNERARKRLWHKPAFRMQKMLCKLWHLPSENIESFRLCWHGHPIISTTSNWCASKNTIEKECEIKQMWLSDSLFAWDTHCIALNFSLLFININIIIIIISTLTAWKMKMKLYSNHTRASWFRLLIQRLVKIRNVDDLWTVLLQQYSRFLLL